MLHIGALAVAPLTLVQAFSAAGLALVVPASARLARSPLHRAERVAVAVIVAALAVLAISPVATSIAPASAGMPLLFLGVALVAAGALAATRGPRRGAALALAAGVLYGLSDAATKGFTDAAAHERARRGAHAVAGGHRRPLRRPPSSRSSAACSWAPPPP